MMTPDLRVLFWELTARCNLHCRHCRAEAGMDLALEELSTEQIFSIARDIRSAADPILVLTGGEPLMREDFFDIARYCCSLFKHVAVASNGTCINDETARLLLGCGVKRVSISLDGADAQTHDSFRGQQGCFRKALAGYENLKYAGMSLQINTTISRHNYRQLNDMIANAVNLQADAFHLFVLVPVGCGVEIPQSERLTAQEIETCLRELHRQSAKLAGKLHIKATCAPQYYRILHEQGETPASQPNRYGKSTGHGMHAVTRGCLAGSSVCFISHSGEVQPCGYLPLVAGDVLQTPFGAIWEHSEIFQTLRDPSKLQGTCGICTHKMRCQGCRARAYAQTGDYMDEDPDCIFHSDNTSSPHPLGVGQ